MQIIALAFLSDVEQRALLSRIVNSAALLFTGPLTTYQQLIFRFKPLIADISLSFFLDNTNADVDTRSQWVNVAKEANVPIRCIYFSAPPEVCKHNNAVRAANISLVSQLKRFRICVNLVCILQKQYFPRLL